MAEFGERMTYTMKAGADLSAVQYHIMRDLASGNQTNIASDATNTGAIGVLQNKPAATDRAASIAYAGTSKVVAGGSVTMGDLVTTNSSGRGATAGSGDMVVGRALQTSSTDGEVITAVLYPPYIL
jgi:hypothetical protein